MKQFIKTLALLLVTKLSFAQTPVEGATVGEFKNMRTFITPGGFAVPKGVTSIMVEIWGAGGGGTVLGGGGGGAYAKAIIPVAEGNTIIAEPGVGGTGHLTGANRGQSSGISYKVGQGAPVNLIRVEGGGGSESSFNTVSGGIGGSVVEVRVTTIGFSSLPGEDGSVYQDFSRQNGSNIITTRHYGKGGDAGNALNSGGRGAITDGPTVTNIRRGGNGKLPGGGGGASYSTKGYDGAQGMVIIYW